jgi:hypothetical protein
VVKRIHSESRMMSMKMRFYGKSVLGSLINVCFWKIKLILLVECQTAQGIEWMKLTLPQTFEDSVVIHRELPVLP